MPQAIILFIYTVILNSAPAIIWCQKKKKTDATTPVKGDAMQAYYEQRR